MVVVFMMLSSVVLVSYAVSEGIMLVRFCERWFLRILIEIVLIIWLDVFWIGIFACSDWFSDLVLVLMNFELCSGMLGLVDIIFLILLGFGCEYCSFWLLVNMMNVVFVVCCMVLVSGCRVCVGLDDVYVLSMLGIVDRL